MSPAWLWGILMVGILVALAVAGSLLVRRRFGVETLKLNNAFRGILGGIGILR